MKKICLLVSALLIAAPALAATQTIERTVSVSQDGEVSIELIAGSVRVTTWERDEVRITGTIDDEFEELEVEADGDDVRIEVGLIDHEQRHARFEPAAELEIVVPARVELSIETVSAGISVDGLSGRVGIESVSGRIQLRGPIEDVDIESISGRIEVEIEGALRSGSFETVAGDIDLRGELSANGRLSLESVNGDIAVHLPAHTSASFNIETFSGDIKSDFGTQATKTSEFLPSQELSFSLGSGGARVEISSFNGTVELIEE